MSRGVEDLEARPKRKGKFFIAFSDTLRDIQYVGDAIDLGEFFSCFDGAEKLTSTEGLYAVQLTDDQIAAQRDSIRISSYRWQQIVRPRRVTQEKMHTFCIPTNFSWFLDIIKENKQIGWMDFLATIGVNCPLEDVMGYMGELYADNIVLGEWLIKSMFLEIAEKRGWIHQEQAFGELDKSAILNLFAEAREIGEELKKAPTTSLVRKFWTVVGLFSRFLHCRAYEAGLVNDVKLKYEELKSFEEMSLRTDKSGNLLMNGEEYNRMIAEAAKGGSKLASEHVEMLLLADDEK